MKFAVFMIDLHDSAWFSRAGHAASLLQGPVSGFEAAPDRFDK
jgi:hypothetical protein